MKKFSIFNFQFSIPQKQAGFTILESIVAILVLSLSIAGVFSAVQQSLSQTNLAKEEVRAFYLAQEAVEMIRNLRDGNRLRTISGSPTNWLTNIAASATDPCYFGKTCRVDITGPGGTYLYSCGSGWNSCEVLRQNSSTFLYGYDGSWPATNFKREIQLEQINGNEVSVVVRVSWSKGLINKEFKIKTQLFNWI